MSQTNLTNTDSRNSLRWLHLSDFHLKKRDKWSQDVVLETLLEDISNRYSGPNALDFIFITGDLAFSGRVEEYVLVENFLEKLLDVTRVPRSRLMMVPGNHDIDRDMEIDAFHGARGLLTDPAKVDKFLGNKARRRTLFRRQAAFREFSNGVYGTPLYSDTSYTHANQLTVFGLDICVLLIDSSWLSEGGSNDAHAILVGERQLLDVLKMVRGSPLTIALIHHPFDWLAPFEHSTIRNLLTAHCHLIFRGHVHEDSVETMRVSTNHTVVFTAGASYTSRLSDNCYSYGAIDILSGDGECIAHKYRNSTKSWEKQEAITWSLLDQPSFAPTLAASHDCILSHSPPYSHYLACLIGQKAEEIPVRYNGNTIMLPLADSNAYSTPLASVVRQLRHIIRWREAWTDSTWQALVEETLERYSTTISTYSASVETASLLSARDSQCKTLMESLNVSAQSTLYNNQAIGQAAVLANKGSLTMAESILVRVVDTDETTEPDALSAYRILTKIYLVDDRIEESVTMSEKVLSFSLSAGMDYLVAATCAYNAEDFITATRYVERACELGVPSSDTRTLAIRISGQTGDAQLLQRLRGEK